MPYSEFIRLTWAQFISAYQGWGKHQFRQRMEGARLTSYIIAAVNRDPKKPFPRSPAEWMRFPTDEEVLKDDNWARMMRYKIRKAAADHEQKYSNG